LDTSNAFDYRDTGTVTVMYYRCLLSVFIPAIKVTKLLFGGFDPGSGLTLAACLRHASRTGCYFVAIQNSASGERVSNTKVTCLRVEHNSEKSELILHILCGRKSTEERLRSL
jgi:hypothetical protein